MPIPAPYPSFPHLLRCVGALLASAPCVASGTPESKALPAFPASAIWNQDVSAVAPDLSSSAMISASGAWGTGGTSFSINFAHHVVYASWGAVTDTAFQGGSSGYNPDCDSGFSLPLPATGAIEGTTGYSCDTNAGDCRLLLVSGDTLYESFASTLTAGHLESACLVRWRLDLDYPPAGRGDGCTSASVSGMPIAPLLATPDAVYAAMQVSGDLGHALAFSLPNGKVRKSSYVHPASYTLGNSLDANAIPYGARLRLSSTFVITGYNAAAQVILRTLKKYGMFMADPGNIPLEFDDGLFDTHQWSDVDIGMTSTSLWGVALSDFDVMPIGTPVAFAAGNCTLSHFGDDVVYSDGFNW